MLKSRSVCFFCADQSFLFQQYFLTLAFRLLFVKRALMGKISLFQKLRVWCRLPSGQWESGVIQSTSGECAFVSLSNRNVRSSVVVIS